MAPKKSTPSEIIPVQQPAPLAIPTAATRTLTPAIWHMIGEMAPVLYKAHLFDVRSPEQAAAIMLKGFELGLSMTASFEFVQVIQGKQALSSRGAMALLLSNPMVKNVTMNRLDDGKSKFIGYECRMERVNGFHFIGRFTLEDANRAGLLKPDSGWAKYPENMCLWRAVGFAADVVFPDITAGMTTLMKAPEMYGVALTEGGDVIDATPPTVASVDPLNELLSKFSADAIMAANDGKIPSSDEEIATVRAKLEQAST